MTSQEVFKHYSFNAHERNVLFVNAGGRRFFEAGYPAGIDVDLEGRGVAVADLDHDGGLDLVVRSVARQKILYLRNRVAARARFLRVDLRATVGHRDAIGAEVRLVVGTERQLRIKTAGSGFQAQSEGTLHFGLGAAEKVDELTVRWPSGREERLNDLPVDHVVRLVEGEGIVELVPRSPSTALVSEPVAKPPAFTARTFAGEAWRPRRGHPALVSLWASWCQPCRQEVPELNMLSERLGDAVDVVGISIEGDAAAARAFYDSVAPSYAMARVAAEEIEPLLAIAFSDGVMPLPAAILLDAEGRVRRVFRGAASTQAMERQARRLVPSPISSPAVGGAADKD